MQEHAETLGGTRKRRIHVGNLDPAAEVFGYDCTFDIRDLISVPEVMEELGLGPNGGLLYAMEYLLENLDWLEEALDYFADDEYLILDCPGQRSRSDVAHLGRSTRPPQPPHRNHAFAQNGR